MAKLTRYEKAVLAWNYFVSEEKRVISELRRKGDAISQKDKLKIGKREEFIEAGEILKEHYDSEIKRLLGRVPPQAVDLEETILASIIMFKTKVFEYREEEDEQGNKIRIRYPVNEPGPYDLVKSFLMPEHFYDEAHAILYKELQRMYNEGIPVDMRTVVNELRSSGNIEKVGGAFYIADICVRLASAANIVYYARKVVEYSIKNQLIKYGAEVMNDSYEDTNDVFKNLDKAEEQLKEITKLNVRP